MSAPKVSVGAYLVVGVTFKKYPTGGDKPTVRLTMNKPALAAHEIALRLDLQLPQSLFKKPSLQATLTIPEGDTSYPVITPEIASNIADVIREQTGIVLAVSAPEVAA